MHDDGGDRDPITLVQPGGLVRIRGCLPMQFPVVGHCRCGCTTILAQTLIQSDGSITQRPFPVFTCTIETVMPAVPEIPAGHLDAPTKGNAVKADPTGPKKIRKRVREELRLPIVEPSVNGNGKHQAKK